MDWQHFIFDPKENILSSMDHVAQKRFFDSELAREAVDSSLEAMRNNDWAKLNQFEGRNQASAKTFFFIVFRRCLEDHYRKLFGRCEPPVWVKKLGQFWSTLYKQVCCQQIAHNQLLVQYHHRQSEEEVQSAVQTIKSKDPKCLTRGKKISVENVEDIDNTAAFSEGNDIVYQQQKQAFEQVLNGLHIWLSKEPATSEQSQYLLDLLTQLSLPDESVVLLRLIYQEGFKVPQAAELIGIPPHTARRRKNDALSQITECFRQAGITGDYVDL